MKRPKSSSRYHDPIAYYHCTLYNFQTGIQSLQLHAKAKPCAILEDLNVSLNRHHTPSLQKLKLYNIMNNTENTTYQVITYYTKVRYNLVPVLSFSENISYPLFHRVLPQICRLISPSLSLFAELRLIRDRL